MESLTIAWRICIPAETDIYASIRDLIFGRIVGDTKSELEHNERYNMVVIAIIAGNDLIWLCMDANYLIVIIIELEITLDSSSIVITRTLDVIKSNIGMWKLSLFDSF